MRPACYLLFPHLPRTHALAPGADRAAAVSILHRRRREGNRHGGGQTVLDGGRSQGEQYVGSCGFTLSGLRGM